MSDHKPNLVYILADDMGYGDLSCLNPESKILTEYLDRLAAEGMRFNNCYATDTPCLPSRTAFFSGRFGTCTGAINHGGEYADLPLQGESRRFRSDFAQDALGSVLRRAGYHTAMISPFPNRHTSYQVTYGFSETHDTGGGGQDDAHEVYPVMQRWLQNNGAEDNWFLHVNFWDPHSPYDHPEEYGNPFADEPIEDWITQDLIDRQNESFGPHSATEVSGITDKLPDGWRMGRGHIKTLDDAKAHLKDLIAFDTVSRNSNRALIDHMAAHFEALGGEITLLPDETGAPGTRNDLRCVSLEHKLGINGSPTCVMAYGDDEGAVGYLVGEENRGLEYMFTMMNNARLNVGLQGLAISERAYQQARSSDQQRVIQFSDKLVKLFSNEQPLLKLGRTVGLLSMEFMGTTKMLFAQQAMGQTSRLQQGSKYE